MNLWQSSDWEAFQKALGHKTCRIMGQLMIITPLFRGKSYGYFPRGPIVKSDDMNEFSKQLKGVAEKEQLIFTKIDPENDIDMTPHFKIRRTTSSQPENTLILDLKVPESEILSQMKRKGRYNIQLAEKKGVEVSRALSDEERRRFVQIFYRLTKETTERNGFYGHDESYYQSMLRVIPQADIFVAQYEDTPLAAAISVMYGSRAIYYYGASTVEHRELMAPYLLQWRMMQYYREKGVQSYDLLGIAPDGASESHPWKGITAFKNKFGGECVSYPRAQDLIHKPLWYRAYRMAKTLQILKRMWKKGKRS